MARADSSICRIPFASMQWEQVRPDVRQKVHCEGGRQVRLVSFDTSDGPQHWCDVGHIGYVLEGALSINFDGKVEEFRAGDGIFIPSGEEHRHRAVSITPGTLLLMIEDV
jgi:quercetin dioxygenase-like cupin family protein